MNWPAICCWHKVVLFAAFVSCPQTAVRQVRPRWSQVSSINPHLQHYNTAVGRLRRNTKTVLPLPPPLCPSLCHVDGLAEERACDWWRTTPEQGASDNRGSRLAPQNLAVQSAADLNRAFVRACLHMHAQAGGSGDGGSPVETQKAEKSVCVSQCVWWRITKICTRLQTKLRKMFYILAFLGFCVCLMIYRAEHLMLYYTGQTVMSLHDGRCLFEEIIFQALCTQSRKLTFLR